MSKVALACMAFGLGCFAATADIKENKDPRIDNVLSALSDTDAIEVALQDLPDFTSLYSAITTNDVALGANVQLQNVSEKLEQAVISVDARLLEDGTPDINAAIRELSYFASDKETLTDVLELAFTYHDAVQSTGVLSSRS